MQAVFMMDFHSDNSDREGGEERLIFDIRNSFSFLFSHGLDEIKSDKVSNSFLVRMSSDQAK